MPDSPSPSPPSPPSTARAQVELDLRRLELREQRHERVFQGLMHLARTVVIFAVLASTANDLTDLSEVRSAALYLIIGPFVESLGLKLKR